MIFVSIMGNDHKEASNQPKNHPASNSILPNLHTYTSNQETTRLPLPSELKECGYGTTESPSTPTSKVQKLKEKAKKKREKYISATKGIPWQIYLSRALSAWGDRIWDFALGIFMNLIHPESLRLAAVQGFVINISVILFGSTIGNWIDRNKRLFAAKIFLAVQNIAVALACGILVIHFNCCHPENISDVGILILLLYCKFELYLL